MKPIGVLLSGCGNRDGSEIHEATLTLAAIDRRGAPYVCIAPHRQQARVFNHYDKAVSAAEQRIVILEAARIARGEVREISTVTMDELDALVLPGGQGAIRNLCDYAESGTACAIDPQVERLLKEALAQKKPIGALCVAPVVVARAFRGAPGVRIKVTIGSDPDTARAIEAFGAVHEAREATEICVDVTYRVVTTPCYMLATRIAEVETGVTRLVDEILAMI
jgi:enhancing lycopene biosynthesis protein 2